MKKFGFMLMAAAVAVMSFTSCEKKPDDIIVDPVVDPTQVPAVDATPGAVTLVIKFDVAPCEGFDILFVGDYGEQVDATTGEPASWNFATAKKMEPLAGQAGWYKIVLKPNAEGKISGRPIQGQNGEGEWDKDWSHNGEDIVALKGVGEGNIADSGYGEINLSFTEADAADAIVAYLQCKKWNLMPCVEKTKYNVTVIVPAFCDEEFAIELVGGFEGWGTAPVALTKVEGNKYTAVAEALEGQEWKVRGQGSWDKEIVSYVAEDDPATTDVDESDTWKGVPNNKFGADVNVIMDYSDPTQYKWNVCE